MGVAFVLRTPKTTGQCFSSYSKWFSLHISSKFLFMKAPVMKLVACKCLICPMLYWIAHGPKEQPATKECKGEWKPQINTFCFFPINIGIYRIGFQFVNVTKVVGPEKGHAKERERDVTKHVKKYLLRVQNNGVKSTMTKKMAGEKNKVLQW